MKIGIISGAFKPFTAGHQFLIDKAVKENKEVYLFVSIKDRIRKNEHPVYWKQMKIVWEQFINPSLNKKIKVYYEENPTVAMFNLLKSFDEDILNKNIYTFYADQEDVKYIENPRMKISLPRLIGNNQLKSYAIDRKENINISGTLARKALQTNDMKTFVALLPEYQQKFGETIFKILLGN